MGGGGGGWRLRCKCSMHVPAHARARARAFYDKRRVWSLSLRAKAEKVLRETLREKAHRITCKKTILRFIKKPLHATRTFKWAPVAGARRRARARAL